MRKFWLLLPVALFGLVVYLFWGVGGAPTPASPVEIPPPTVEHDAPEVDTTSATGDDEASEPQREEVAISAEHAAKEFYSVRVKDKATGEPVSGARVSYYEGSSLFVGQTRDHEAHAEEHGETVIADRFGLAPIPVERYVTVTGRSEELYGERTVAATANRTGDEVYELELERDLALRVQVLDSRGDPVPDVGIGIASVYEADDRRNQFRMPTLAITSGPDGIAVIPHLQTETRSWLEEPTPIASYLRPAIPGFTDGGVPIDVSDPPAEMVVLQLPETGRVLVGVVDAKGNRLPELPFRMVRLGTSPGQSSTTSWGTGLYEGGAAVFERVVVGKTYYARASTRFGWLEGGSPGPRARGDEVTISLPMDTGYWGLRGRILDPEGIPLADARIRTWFEAEATNGSASFDTRADGSFWVFLRPADIATRVSSLSFEFRRTGTFPLVAVLNQDRRFQLGENDAGDVILGESQPQLICSGRVLIDGEPLQEWPDGTLRTFGWYPDSERWSTADLNRRITREPDGRFAIRTTNPVSRYQLQFRENRNEQRFLPARSIEFEVGAEDLVLNLESAGSLSADVLIDGIPPLDGLWLRLVPTDGQVPERDLVERPSVPRFNRNRLYAQPGRAANGRQPYRWSTLWPGRYVLEVLARGGRNPVLTVPNVQIERGSNRDPRLHDLDLQGRFHEITVKVTDPAGTPIEEPLILIQNPGGQALQGYQPREGNSSAILMADSYVNLLVTARDHQPKEVSGVATDTTVVLEPYPEIGFTIAGGLPELGAGRALEVSLLASGDPDPRDYSSDSGGGRLFGRLQPRVTSGLVDDGNQVALQYAGAGNYSVVVSVVNTVVRKTQAVIGLEPTEVELGESGQVIELRVPEAGLKTALAGVR